MFGGKSSTSNSLLSAAGLGGSSGTVLDQLDALPALRKSKYQRLTVRRDLEMGGSKIKKKTKEEEEEEKRFIAAVNQILVQVPRDKIHTVWLRLFAERMHASQTLTTPNQMEHYMTVFTDWLEVVPPSEANSVNRKLALAFLSGFASTHAIDPDNSIIGLMASEKAIAMAQKVRDEQQADYDSYAKLLRLEPGDLCLVKKAVDKWIWARVSKVLPGNKIQVFFDPLEGDSETVSTSDAYPLGDQLASNSGNVKLQEKLVFSPAEEFFTQLNTEIRNRSSQFLQDQGVNLVLLRRLSRNEFALSDLPVLKQVRTQLSKLLDNLETTDFFKNIKSYAGSRVATFLGELKPETLFPPTRNRVLEHLKVTQFAALARVDIQKYIAVCDSTLDLIVLERRKLMSGETKNYLTEWWLHLIRDEVERWLTEQGYDHEAVPYNYIEQAPTSLDICRKNLQLLQTILSTLGDKSQPVHIMITRLKNEIYPKIDEFIEKSQHVICEHLGVEPTNFTPQASRTALEAKQKDGLLKDPQIIEPLSNLILDLEYLQEMKHLEDNPPTAGGLKLGVVPISGVIVGYFYRYENELITVLDVWGGGSQPAAPSPQPNPSMIEQSLAAVTRNRAPSAIDAANLTDNAYLGENLKREQISFMRLSAMNVSARKEFISEQSHNAERLRRSHQEGFRQRTTSDDDAGVEDAQISALLNEFAELQNKQLQVVKQLCERDEFNRATIRKLRTEFARIQEREFSSAAALISANPAKKVVLNVGGTKYATTSDTFQREPESQLAQLVRAARFDTEVFIDRDGAVFAHVLNYLRDGTVSGASEDMRAQLAREAKFFGLNKLLSLLDATAGKLSPKAPTSNASSTNISRNLSPQPQAVKDTAPAATTTNGTAAAVKPSASTTTASGSARTPAPGTGTLPRGSSDTLNKAAVATSGSVVGTKDTTLKSSTIEISKEGKSEIGSRPPSEQATTAAAAASLAASTVNLANVQIPAPFAGNPVASHWYLFLLSAQVPEDACISYANIFMEKNIKPEQVSGMSQQALKDIGIKMGHIMKIQKAKVPPR